MSRTAVIILNWNGRELLERYVPQVIANTAKSFGEHTAEIIVADNASTDSSVAYLTETFPEVRVMTMDKNYGFAEGYNRALAALDHDYAVLLNSDAAPAPGWLEPLVSLMGSDQKIGACGPKLRDDKAHDLFEYAGAAGGYIDWLGYPFCRGRVMESVEQDRGQYDDTRDTLWMSGAALMVRRQTYVEMGGLDADFFAHMEEIDLCWRMRNAGWRVVACGESAVYHLGGATIKLSPRKTYLNFRNSLTMLIKNHNSRAWWAVLFARLVLDGVAGLRFVAAGQWSYCWAIVRAHGHLWQHLRSILGKRKALSPLRQREVVPEVRRYSMIWRYYALGKRTFAEIDKP